jgi:hypothetical protein
MNECVEVPRWNLFGLLITRYTENAFGTRGALPRLRGRGEQGTSLQIPYPRSALPFGTYLAYL